MPELVVIKGGGDLATGVAHRLHRAGFLVVITELAQPTVIRRAVAFATAVYEGHMMVEGVVARRASLEQVEDLLREEVIPVLMDPQAEAVRVLRPLTVVDAVMAKRNTGTCITDAPIVIGLGPGFTAGMDVHAVIETERGHNLGRVILEGSAAPDTGAPGPVGGVTVERVLRAPRDGIFRGLRAIGQRVEEGEAVAYVDDAPVVARVGGVIRGLLADGLAVRAGMKVGDIDPRSIAEHCFIISDKARAVGGGVLEAILYLSRRDGGPG